MRSRPGYVSQRHSNTTIGSLLSKFCSELFPNFDFHIGDPISFIPHENEKMDFPPLKIVKIQTETYRVCLWDAVMLSPSYCVGIEYPAKSDILPPCAK